MPISKTTISSPEPIRIPQATVELNIRKEILADVQNNLAEIDVDSKKTLTVKEKFYVAMELFYEKFLKDQPNLEASLDDRISKFLNNRII